MIARIISGGTYKPTTHPRWKYRTTEDLIIRTAHYQPIRVKFRASNGYIIGEWHKNILIINKGYTLDGASCWPDHPIAMPGFIFHDFGYQLAQILPRITWDQGMRDIHALASYKLRHIVYAGVRLGGWKSYGKRDYIEILTAP